MTKMRDAELAELAEKEKREREEAVKAMRNEQLQKQEAAAKAEAARLVAEAETALAPFGDKAQSLRDLARFIIARDR